MGLIYPEARYVSVYWRTTERLQRVFAGAELWPLVSAELAFGWERDIVSAAAATRAALLGPDVRHTFAVRRAAQIPVLVRDEDRIKILNDMLRAIASSE